MKLLANAKQAGKALVAKTSGLWRGTVSGSGTTGTLHDTSWWRNLMGAISHTGKAINEDTVMQVTAMYSALRLVTETIGTLPIHVYERTATGKERALDHPLYNLLNLRSSYYETSTQFLEGIALSLCLHNTGYILVLRSDDGKPVGLKAVPKPSVQPRVLKDRKTIVYEVTREGIRETYQFGDIIPIKGFGHVDDLEGLSVMRSHKDAFGLAMAAEEYGARFFAGGQRPSGVFTIDTVLKPEQREKLRDALNKRYTGLENAHEIALLEANMKYVPMASSNTEAQLLESRKFQVLEIARIMRVPPHMLYEMDRATYANAEQNRQEFVDFTLRPYLVRIERAINAFLIPPNEQHKYFVEFNLDGLLRGDSKTRGEFYQRLAMIGAISVAEIRRRENLPYVEGTEELKVLQSMVPFEDAKNVSDEENK